MSSGRNVSIRWLFTALMFVFILSTLFDPADLLFGLKVPLFVAAWGIGGVLCLTEPERVRVPVHLLVYISVLITIPLISIAGYYVRDGSAPFAGFQMMKAYVFLSMAVLLYITRTDLLPSLSHALTVLAGAVLTVAVIVLIWPSLFMPLYVFGNLYGVFTMDNRDYGSGVVLFQMYFVTSPMLAMSAAYFFHRAWTEPTRRGRFILVTVMHLAALVIAGSRNNLFAGVMIPLLLWLLHARRKGSALLVVSLSVLVGLHYVGDTLRVLLDPTEVSNETKLRMLTDYDRIFESSSALLFGRGLGAYEHWSGRGYYFITELTYLEVIRNFGLIMGAVVMACLLFPIVRAFTGRATVELKSVAIGYALYLVMCASNPNLFSSMGMLILSVLLANLAFGSPGQPGAARGQTSLRPVS